MPSSLGREMGRSVLENSLNLCVCRIPGRWPFPEVYSLPLRRGGGVDHALQPCCRSTEAVRSPPHLAPSAIESASRVTRRMLPPVARPVSSCLPLCRAHLQRVLPQTSACFGLTPPSARHVPSTWFHTTSTDCATEGIGSLLHLPADHGVHRVAGHGRACLRRFASIPTVPDPSERSPPPTAAVASPRGHAPLPLPPGGDRLRGFHPSGSPLWPSSVAGPHHPRLSWVSLVWSVSSVACSRATEVDRQHTPQDRGRALQGEPRGVEPSGLPACPSRCQDVLASPKPPSAPALPKKDRPHRRSDPQRTCCGPRNLTAPRQTPRRIPGHNVPGPRLLLQAHPFRKTRKVLLCPPEGEPMMPCAPHVDPRRDAVQQVTVRRDRPGSAAWPVHPTPTAPCTSRGQGRVVGRNRR